MANLALAGDDFTLKHSTPEALPRQILSLYHCSYTDRLVYVPTEPFGIYLAPNCVDLGNGLGWHTFREMGCRPYLPRLAEIYEQASNQKPFLTKHLTAD